MGRTGRKRVLVIEDDPHVARLLVRWMEKLQAEVRVAATGGEAVRSAVAEKPDLILADLLLPDMDGLEAVGKIREQLGRAAPPVVVLTGHASPENIRQAVDQGVVDFLTKPTALTDPSAEDRIRRLLEGGPAPEKARRRSPGGKRRRR